MLSVQSASQPKLARPELPPLQSTRSPSPGPAPTSAIPASPRPLAAEGLDNWFQELQKYEATLNAMAAASEDPKFREELGTIEQWFKLLSESEQTASLYTLLQHANQAQVKFLAAVLNQMSSESVKPSTDTKAKQAPRNLRPPSLNLPLNSPVTPHINTPASAVDTDKANIVGTNPDQPAQDVSVKNNWASQVSTPLVRMFPKGSEATQATNGQPATPAVSSPVVGLPGMPMMNPFNMAMLNQMGYSNEAQLLAVQMVMSGLVQPPIPPHKNPHQPRGQKPSAATNWRSPVSAKYPASALRTGGLKTSGLRSSGLRSAGPKSATPLASAGATPKDSDDIDPELLKDIPAWLKSLRLHKYTHCFDGMTWQDMVVLDDATLEAKGVAALGARRRLLKTFDLVKRRMGMETSTPTDTTPASAVLPSLNTNLPSVLTNDAPHSAAPAFAH